MALPHMASTGPGGELTSWRVRLLNALSQLPKPMAGAAAADLFHGADANQDSVVEFPEFKKVFEEVHHNVRVPCHALPCLGAPCDLPRNHKERLRM